jgi:hypothetical protein
MTPVLPQSPWRSNGPLSLTENMSMAVMRPSLVKPTFTRPRTPGRARPMYCSSSLVTRIITGALAFFDSNTGITSEIAPVILLPKPPPVYSLMTTTLAGSMPTHRETPSTVCAVLCVPVYT